MKRRAPRTHLTEEERALWRRVAETARPLRPCPAPAEAVPAALPPAESAAAPRAAPTAARTTPAPSLPRVRADLSPLLLRPAGRPEPAARWAAPAADRPAPVRPDTPGLDRGTARRLGRGRIAPQARLDLHGMTADRAHAALGRFIEACAAGGLRCVLVVTGKGGDGEGVLRRETPRWLGTPPFAAMVVGVFESHVRHGGGGALYVYLKRRR